MHSNPLTGDDREVVRLDVEYGLQEKVYVNEKVIKSHSFFFP